MKRFAGLIAVVTVAATLLISSLPGLAIENRYTEDFSTTRYKDKPHTTALWDTVAGELKLHPFVPTIVGTYNTPGTAYDVTVSGDHAFVADYTYGLQVISISNPASPTLVGTCNTPGNAMGVTVSGNYAFVADFGSGLQVIDISNPASPTLVGTCDTPGYAWGVTVSGDRAFVADDYAGLQVIDISNPASPTIVGTYNTPGTAYGVAVSGDHAFVADYTYGLQVISISNPASPTLVGTYDTPGYAWGVTVSGDRAFVADDALGLQVIDIGNPASPTLAGTRNTPGIAWGVTVSGDYAFVADYGSGLQAIRIGYPAAPALVGTGNTPGSVCGVAVSGDHAFVADGSSGLQVVDIGDLESPALIGAYNAGDWYGDVAVLGDYAYLAAGANGLRVINISNLATPALSGTCDTPGFARRLTVLGDHAFVADETGGLQVIDISNPANPTLVGTYNTPGSGGGVEVSGSYAFVADYFDLLVIDISNPVNPTLVVAYEPPGGARAVAVSGDHAFVLGGGAYSFQVIDISDPANPTLVGSASAVGDALTVSGDYAFVTSLGDQGKTALSGTSNIDGNAHGATGSRAPAIPANVGGGLFVFDISDLGNPELVGSYQASGAAFGVDVSGEYAFVGDGGSGLQVIQVFQSELDAGSNAGRSLAVDSRSDAIVRARAVSTQTNTVTWELSADGGSHWQGIAIDGSWATLTVPGSDLLWRSTHAWAAPGVNPAVTGLEIEWLHWFPNIEAITDVGNDQGRQVRIDWTRSGNDFVGASPQITEYAIFRRIDPVAISGVLEATATAAARAAAITDPEIAAALVAGWDYVTAVPADAVDEYAVVVPTLADSTIAEGQRWSIFRVRARTAIPGVYYESYPDSGCSVDNLEPNAPVGFAVAYNTGIGNELTWTESGDEDFRYFCIYRSTSSDFTPGEENRVGMITAMEWTDPDYDGWGVYYKITVVDFSGNESAPASPGTVTEADGPSAPAAYTLYQNAPNPFNPSTSISFDLKEATDVSLVVYDVSGRLMRVLVSGRLQAQRHETVWDGVDANGRPVASGVYFYRLIAGSFTQTKKMILIR